METEQIIKDQLNKLPAEMASIFFDQELPKKILSVGKSFNLNDEQIKKLETETYLLILGLTSPEDYQNELKEQIGVEEDVSERVCDSIEKILPEGTIDKLADFCKNDKNEITDDDISHKIPPENISYDSRFLTLPQELQNAIARSDWKNKLYGIAQNHKLNIEQMGILEDVTAQVILNTVHGDQYENTLIGKLNISGEEAGKIAGEVNESILKSIREIEMSSKKQVVSSTEQVVGSKENANTEEIPLPPYVRVSSKQNVERSKEKINSMEQVVGSKENANTENKPINPLEEKLMRPTISTQNIPNNSAPKVDPYREQF